MHILNPEGFLGRSGCAQRGEVRFGTVVEETRSARDSPKTKTRQKRFWEWKPQVSQRGSRLPRSVSSAQCCRERPREGKLPSPGCMARGHSHSSRTQPCNHHCPATPQAARAQPGSPHKEHKPVPECRIKTQSAICRPPEQHVRNDKSPGASVIITFNEVFQ